MILLAFCIAFGIVIFGAILVALFKIFVAALPVLLIIGAILFIIVLIVALVKLLI